MEAITTNLMSFIRLALYGYIVFVGYVLFRTNGHDRKIEALLVGNIVLSFIMSASNITSLVFEDDTRMIRTIFLTFGVLFWAMTHLYVYLREGKK